MAKQATKPTEPLKEQCRTCKFAVRKATSLEFFMCQFMDYANLPTFRCDDWEAK